MFIAKHISGLQKARYGNEPINFLLSVASAEGEPSSKDDISRGGQKSSHAICIYNIELF